MSDHRPGDVGDDTDAGPGQDSAPGRPRWMFVLGIAIAAALVVLIVVLHLTGTIGPGTH